MKKCAACNHIAPDDAKFCSSCGEQLSRSNHLDATASADRAGRIAAQSPSNLPQRRLYPRRFQLQISAQILSWPRHCACCMREANGEIRAAASKTKGKRVKHTTTRWWDVPYCAGCREHVRRFNSASNAMAPFIFLGFLAWIGIGVATGTGVGGFIAGVAICLCGIWPYNKALARARESLTSACTAERAAVVYRDWHGNFHTFVFTNRLYLQEFIAANQRKTMSDIREV